jgi:YegS/Rv2252/BmrU family lipid kinase
MAKKKPTAALIFNPSAGRGAQDVEQLRTALAASFGLTVHATSPDHDADACAHEALVARPEVLVVAGGDGTVSMVAGALMGSNTALGIVPWGTANSIAAALGIPGDERAALETIAGAEVRAVDCARANGRAMLLHASVGFHAATIGETDREAKNRWGVLAYLAQGVSKLSDFEQFQVRIETEHEIVQCRAINVMIANAAPLKTVLAQGPAEVVPDDGVLDVTIVAAEGLAETVATGLHLLTTAALQEGATRDNVGYFSARRVIVDADPPQALLIDGELVGEGRLEVECFPRSIRVLVPAGVAESVKPIQVLQSKLEGLPDLEVEPIDPK